MKFKSIEGLKNIENKTVLVYADFDCEITPDGSIVDDRKIRELVNTLEKLIFSGAKVLIFSNETDNDKLEIVLKYLNKYLKLNYNFKNKIVYYNNSDIDRLVDVLNLVSFGDIVVVKNFFAYINKYERVKSCHDIVKKISNYCYVFVFENFANLFTNDYFAVNFSRKLKTYFGISFLNKLDNYTKMTPEKNNSVAVVGGEYNNTKIDFIENLLVRGFYVILGGEVSSVFIKVFQNKILAKQKKINKNSSNRVLGLIKRYRRNLILPVDFMVSRTKDKSNSSYVKSIADLSKYDNIYDIGPETIKKSIPYIKKAKLLIWSGLLGMIEDKKFSHGSTLVAQLFCNRSKGSAFGVVVGNRTCKFLSETKYGEDVDYCFYEKDTFYRLFNEEDTQIKF